MPRVYIESYGCSLNLSEGEAMGGILRSAGHELVDSPSGADAVIVNMCSVKTPTERKILRRVRELRAENGERSLIVAGCIPPGGKQKIARISPDISLVTTQNLQQIGSAVARGLAGEKVEMMGRAEGAKLGLPKARKNPVVSIVPISTGCDLACSYCVTTIIKGQLLSYPAKDIRDEISRDYAEGCREFWLTSQDNGAYYTDRLGRCMLPDLLKGIAELPGNFRVRVGMTNPVYVTQILDELIESFGSEKIFKFLHIPLQSGSDRVLADMKRGYTSSDFLAIVAAFRRRYPDISIATDVICGLPGETEEDFAQTLAVVAKARPDILNISRFWPRDGTKAALRDDQLNSRITKERSTRVAGLFEEILAKQRGTWVGWEGAVLVDEPGTKEGTMLCRSDGYRLIAIPGGRDLLGKRVRVRVVGAGKYYLRGELLERMPVMASSRSERLMTFPDAVRGS